MTVAYATPLILGPHSPRLPPRMETRWIADGDEGAVQTLRLMAKVAREALLDPVVLERAAHVVSAVAGRDGAGQLRAIRQFLTYSVKYQLDPDGLELLRTPRYLLDRVAAMGRTEGDCDDIALLGATLGLAVGLPARFVAVGFRGPKGPFSHVWAELLVDSAWRELDTTRPIGATGLRPSRRIEYEVQP